MQELRAGATLARRHVILLRRERGKSLFPTTLLLTSNRTPDRLGSMTLKEQIRRKAPAFALAAWRRRRLRPLSEAWAQLDFFADVPVDPRNISLYRQENFPKSGPVPWLDRPDAEERIEERLANGEINHAEAASCRSWRRDGFLHLTGFHDNRFLDAVWQAVEEAIEAGNIPVTLDTMTEGGPWEGRAQDLHGVVPLLADLLRHKATLDLIGLLLGQQTRPFQTISFFAGSEQAAHSDSIHMATYPEGYLVGAWVAMEDIHKDSGPLVYYPGSHHLPYQLSQAAGISAKESLTKFYEAYSQKYEPFVAGVIEKEGLEPVIHTPRKGDLLLWHANLLHGGTARADKSLSRKSVVCHYFVEGALCYHDLSATLARLE